MKALVIVLFLIEFISILFFCVKEFRKDQLSFKFGIAFGLIYFIFIPISLILSTGNLFVSRKDFGATSIPDVVLNNELISSLILIAYIAGIILYLFSPRLKPISITKVKGSTDWRLPTILYMAFMLTIFIGSGILEGGNWYNNRHHFMEKGGSLAVLMMFCLNASKVLLISSLIFKWTQDKIKSFHFFSIMITFLLLDMILTGNRIYAFISFVLIGLFLFKRYTRFVLKYSLIGLPIIYYLGYFASIFRHMRGPLFLYGLPTPSYFWQVLTNAIRVEPPDIYNFLSGISESVNVNVIYGLINSYSEPLFGTTYLKSVLFPIPRRIWPNKPISITNIAGDYFGSESLVTTIIGEIHMNYMFIGILLLPFVLFFTEWVFTSYFKTIKFSGVLLFYVGLMIFRMPYSDTFLIFSFILFISYLGKLPISGIIKTLNEKLD